MTTREDIVSEARTWVGVPYRHQGRSRRGVDCLGLLVMVAKALGISDADDTAYSRNPSATRMRRLLLKHVEAIPPEQAQRGDVLHIATCREPQHLAIVSAVDPVYVVHADSRYGVVEQSAADLWRRVRGAYRIPGLT